MEKAYNNQIVKILYIIGIAAIISFLADLVVVVLPPKFYSPEWTTSISSLIVDRSIIPAIGVLFVLLGIYFNKQTNGTNKALLLKENITGLFALGFATGLIGLTILYSLSIGTVEDNKITQAKQSIEKAQEKLEKKIDVIKKRMPEEKIKTIEDKKNIQIDNMNAKLESYISNAKKKSFKSKFKYFVNVIAFICTFGLIGIMTFITSLKELKLLKFKRNK